MAKKFIMVMLTSLAVIFVITGTAYMYKAGVFEPYPEPVYLDQEQSAERPVYSQLSKEEQALYTALYNGVRDQKTEIPLPYEIDGDTYTKLYCILEKQESDIFYMSSTFYTAEKIRKARMAYREIPGDIPAMEAELEKAVAEFADELSQLGDYEKALEIHDYIIEKCTYEIDYDDGLGATAYGCLMNGSSHCEGYAKAFDVLAKACGLESIVVTGVTDEGENHAWNQVKIHGEWYNCDVTWDDTDTADDLRHTYFLVEDESFTETHMADTEHFAPFACRATENTYFNKNDLYINNDECAEEIIAREIEARNPQIELKFADKELYEGFKERFMEGEEIFQIILASGVEGELTISVTENEKELCLMLTMPF
ncbi:MAG: hypothetical protein IJO99_01065 [Ruminococcus sp.]|nr:hypothetical protein [Ruminococcus sp.]